MCDLVNAGVKTKLPPPAKKKKKKIIEQTDEQQDTKVESNWQCQVEVPRGSATWKRGGHTIMGGAAQSPENVTWKCHMEALPGYR